MNMCWSFGNYGTIRLSFSATGLVLLATCIVSSFKIDDYLNLYWISANVIKSQFNVNVLKEGYIST